MDLDYSYVSAELKTEYCEEIFAILLEAGIPLPDKYDLHVTIMYDERELDEPLCVLDLDKEYKANVTKLEILGDGIVFHLTSRDIVDEWRRLTEAGYQHSFGTPLPHMSLAYDLGKYELLKLQHAFGEWGGRELVFHNASFGLKKVKS